MILQLGQVLKASESYSSDASKISRWNRSPVLVGQLAHQDPVSEALGAELNAHRSWLGGKATLMISRSGCITELVSGYTTFDTSWQVLNFDTSWQVQNLSGQSGFSHHFVSIGEREIRKRRISRSWITIRQSHIFHGKSPNQMEVPSWESHWNKWWIFVDTPRFFIRGGLPSLTPTGD